MNTFPVAGAPPEPLRTPPFSVASPVSATAVGAPFGVVETDVEGLAGGKTAEIVGGAPDRYRTDIGGCRRAAEGPGRRVKGEPRGSAEPLAVIAARVRIRCYNRPIPTRGTPNRVKQVLISTTHIQRVGDEVPISLSNNFVPRMLTGSDPVRQYHQDRKAGRRIGQAQMIPSGKDYIRFQRSLNRAGFAPKARASISPDL